MFESQSDSSSLSNAPDDSSSPPVYSLEIIDEGPGGCNYYGTSLTVRSTPDKMFLYLLKNEPVWLRVMSSGCSGGVGGGGEEKRVVISHERVIVTKVDMSPASPVVYVKWPEGSSQAKIYPGVFRTSLECIDQIKVHGESSKRSLQLRLQNAEEEVFSGEGLLGGGASSAAALRPNEPAAGPMASQGKQKEEEGCKDTDVIEID